MIEEMTGRRKPLTSVTVLDSGRKRPIRNESSEWREKCKEWHKQRHQQKQQDKDDLIRIRSERVEDNKDPKKVTAEERIEMYNKNLAGVPVSQIAKEYGFCKGTVWNHIREHKKSIGEKVKCGYHRMMR
jgi:DNA invertase Pin-like site-specific DNA recombinase